MSARAEAVDLDELVALVSSADVVSFDVFDTLLDRPHIRPIDTFALARDRVNEVGAVLVQPCWPLERFGAELACYHDPSLPSDIRLDDVYERLAGRDGAAHAAALRDAEVELELVTLDATRRGTRLWEAAGAAGAKRIVLSDMYLPREVVADALRRAGFEDWDALVVSGDDRMSKHAGSAFRWLRARHPDARIVHVGDNALSDVTMANRHDVIGVHLPATPDRPTIAGDGLPVDLLRRARASEGRLHEDSVRSLVAGLAARRFDLAGDRGDVAEGIGYGVLGPLLAGFAQWLHHGAVAGGIRELRFLAREGALLQRAYETMLGDDALPSGYTYASRRMIVLASLESLADFEALNFLTSTGRALRAEQYVTRFVPDIDRAALEGALRGAGLRADELIEPAHAESLHAVFRTLADIIEPSLEVERADVRAYLESERLDHDDVAVVDVGWQGSIQRGIRRIFDSQLQGFYLGVHATHRTNDHEDVHGFIDQRSAGIGRSLHEAVVAPGIEVVEILLANVDAASATTVRRVERGFEPVFSSERMRPGEADVVRRVQDAALEFVEDLRRVQGALPSTSRRLSPVAVAEPMRLLAQAPTRAQARLLGGILHDNTLGVHASALGMPMRDAAHYEEHPDDLEAERGESWWRPGFDVNLARMRDEHAARLAATGQRRRAASSSGSSRGASARESSDEM